MRDGSDAHHERPLWATRSSVVATLFWHPNEWSKLRSITAHPSSTDCQHMRDFYKRIDQLLSDAEDCEFVADLATDPAKGATFRRIALQFRKIAVELKSQMDGGSIVFGPDDQFLSRAAQRCRDLAASTSDEKVATELRRLAADFEHKATAKP